MKGDSLTVGPSAIGIMRRHWPALVRDFDADSYHPQITYYKCTGEKIFGESPEQTFEVVSKTSIGPATFEWSSKDPDAPKDIDRHSRPALHYILMKQIDRCGIVVEYNKRAIDYFEDVEAAKGGVILDGGERRTADLVVASDGMHTTSWGLIGGEEPAARSSGNSIYRTAFPVEHMLKDPILVERFPLIDGNCAPLEMWVGGGMSGVLWRNDKIFGWGLTHKVYYFLFSYPNTNTNSLSCRKQAPPSSPGRTVSLPVTP